MAICAPESAASATSSGLLMLAAIISVVIPWISNIAAMLSTSLFPSDEISLSLPTNGLTYDAPALAARSACDGLNIRVTFVLIPFFERIETAYNPSAVIGILITIFL